jgi:hypothetical protein
MMLFAKPAESCEAAFDGVVAVFVDEFFESIKEFDTATYVGKDFFDFPGFFGFPYYDGVAHKGSVAAALVVGWDFVG